MRSKKSRSFRPNHDALETRMLLYSTTGNAWAYPDRITWSVIPDNTTVAVSTVSNLQYNLGTTRGLTDWEYQLQRAAAAWSIYADINLVQVSDDGASISSGSYQQGDPGHGDIRIGGYSQGPTTLAFAKYPAPDNGGEDAGTIMFATDKSWQTNGTTYDLYRVALHEFGHALGLGHSTGTSVMQALYGNASADLQSDDVSGIRAIYGARANDPYDAAASNNSSTNATVVTSYIGWNDQIRLEDADMTSQTDNDWYKFTAPSTVYGATFRAQALTLSGLRPHILVYDAPGGVFHLLGEGSGSTYGYGANAQTTADLVQGTVYYVKVMPADLANGATDKSYVGAYSLLINLGSYGLTATYPPYTYVAATFGSVGSVEDGVDVFHGNKPDVQKGGHPGGPRAGFDRESFLGQRRDRVRSFQAARHQRVSQALASPRFAVA